MMCLYYGLRFHIVYTMKSFHRKNEKTCSPDSKTNERIHATDMVFVLGIKKKKN